MEESIDLVLAALDDSDEEVRSKAIKALSSSGRSLVREMGASLVPKIIGVLQKRNQYGHAEALREVSFLIIQIADVPGVLPRVILALED